MAKIIPFKAVRPTADKVALVTTLAYDEYNAAELASWLDFNPFSFLHIINPAYVNQQKIDVEQRFKMVATKYNDFKRDDILFRDPSLSMYLYTIKTKKAVFTGIMAGTSIEDYKKNLIKKHENTLDYRVKTLKDYFKISGFSTEPVLMMYPEDSSLSEWIQKKQQLPTLYHFSTTNKEEHKVWKIDQVEDLNFLMQKFDSFEHLYIADGHHRSASSALLYDEAPDKENLNYFMSFLICESDIKINEYNRVVHDLNQHTTEEFLNLLEKDFIIKKIEQQLWKPSQKYQFGMYLDGNYYSLQLRTIPQTKEVLSHLDAQILYEKILHRFLDIQDLRTDSRIDYIPGNKSIVEMFNKIDNGEYKVGFTLFPASIKEIKYLADNSLTMPPKSTYIEPKFRNGLIIYEF